jgi:hypothetical protein
MVIKCFVVVSRRQLKVVCAFVKKGVCVCACVCVCVLASVGDDKEGLSPNSRNLFLPKIGLSLSLCLSVFLSLSLSLLLSLTHQHMHCRCSLSLFFPSFYLLSCLSLSLPFLILRYPLLHLVLNLSHIILLYLSNNTFHISLSCLFPPPLSLSLSHSLFLKCHNTVHRLKSLVHFSFPEVGG